jgi:hypothetical protein
MLTTNPPKKQDSNSVWQELLATISDDDLDTLISASAKMQRGIISLTPKERKVYSYWSRQLDTLLLPE